jgi:predicted signal transduction protein with EAL and GGDEF domain
MLVRRRTLTGLLLSLARNRFVLTWGALARDSPQIHGRVSSPRPPGFGAMLQFARRFPVDTLKIDRSFVSNMDINDNRKIVATIVMLAHNLGLRVVAEGTETGDQLRQLKELQCDFAQGYFFSRPVESDKAEQLLVTRRDSKANAVGET